MQEHHLTHYAILFTGLLLYGVFFYLLRFNFGFQMIATLCISVFYTAWGIVHHSVDGRLTRLIVLEYISFSVFILVLVFLALNI